MAKPNGYLLLSIDRVETSQNPSYNLDGQKREIEALEQLYVQNPTQIPDDYMLIMVNDFDHDVANANSKYNNIIETLKSKNYYFHGRFGSTIFFTNGNAIDYKIFTLIGNSFVKFPHLGPLYTLDVMENNFVPCIIRCYNAITDDNLKAVFTFKRILARSSNLDDCHYYIMEKRQYNVKAAVHKK